MKKRKKDSEPREHRVVGSTPSRPAAWIQYRFLAVVILLATPLAVYELLADGLPSSTSEVRKEWLLTPDKNLAETLVELYPDRAMGHIFRAYQAGMCVEDGFQDRVCRHFPNQNLLDVRFEWEAAMLHAGDRNYEDAFHNYAFLLYQLGEMDRAEQVVRVWRANYPHSLKPHPRDLLATDPVTSETTSEH